MTADQISIPAEALNQHTIVLGKTRAGKSSTMRLFVEGLLEVGRPVCIIDPKGDWWGLKSSRDGTKAGFPVTIFGGDHADVPINEHSGKVVGELVATGNRPCIIDLGGWMVGPRTRFFIDFASTFFRLTRGPRHLVVDEVHNFAPQGKIMNPDAGKMLHWANRLASEGAGKGITLISASQRPQKVHKDYVTSHETLVAMRVIHPLDRGAVKDWIDGCPDPALGREVMASLASMNRGEAWVWSPEIGFGPVKVQFPLFSTYDSFAAPTSESNDKLKGWAEVDLDDVRAQLAEAVEDAKANDPNHLKSEIARLTAELGAAQKDETPAWPDQREAVARLHDEGRAYRAKIASLERVARDAAAGASGIAAQIEAVLATDPAVGAAAALIEQGGDIMTVAEARAIEGRRPPPPELETEAAARAGVAPPPRRLDDAESRMDAYQYGEVGTELSKKARDFVEMLERINPARVTWAQLATMIGGKPSGGTFNTAKRQLQATNLIAEDGKYVRSTKPSPKGLTRAAAAALWRSVLPEEGRTRDMFDVLLDAVNPMTKEEIAAAIGIAPRGGNFSGSFAPLNQNDLVEKNGSTFQLVTKLPGER